MSIKLRKFSKDQSAEEMAKWVFGSTGIDDTWITEFIKAGGNKSMLISELDDKFAEVKKKLDDKMPSRSNKKEFSETKSFSDWDQIRDLVKDQYPRLKFRKIDGSEDDKSYKVMIIDGNKTRVVEIKKDPRKSALDNWVESSRMKVENTSKLDTNKNKDKYKDIINDKYYLVSEYLVEDGEDWDGYYVGPMSKSDAEKYMKSVKSTKIRPTDHEYGSELKIMTKSELRSKLKGTMPDEVIDDELENCDNSIEKLLKDYK